MLALTHTDCTRPLPATPRRPVPPSGRPRPPSARPLTGDDVQRTAAACVRQINAIAVRFPDGRVPESDDVTEALATWNDLVADLRRLHRLLGRLADAPDTPEAMAA